MRLVRVDIRNFRNHKRTVLECSRGVNAFLGDNGEGKTNIIEAISYLCLTKSFYASGDAVVLQIGMPEFEVQGRFVADNNVERSVRAQYDGASGRKEVAINNAPVEILSSIIGEFPVVVLSPEQSGITFGAPSERRKFLDLVVSQSSRLYLEELLDFRRILRQRNKILLQGKLARRDPSEALEPWSTSLVEAGSDLMIRREAFVAEFLPYVVEAYARLAGGHETPSMEYLPSVAGYVKGDVESVREVFRQSLEDHRDEELRMGTTVVGPHRDELEFQVNGMTLRKFASQGQHKTFLIALKLAEFFYLKERCRETPILLLDDVFSELDEHRSERLIKMVEPLGQVFITATDDRFFSGEKDKTGNIKRVIVREGEIASEEKVGLESAE